MTTATAPAGGGALSRPSSSGLADVIDTILDKGLVIDAYVRVSLVGIELLTIDARVVVASVDTYLRFAEAANRLELGQAEGEGLPGLIQSAAGGGKKKEEMARGLLEEAEEKFANLLNGPGEEPEVELEPAPRSKRRKGDS
jgi:gas vesicle structural protein